MLVDVYYNLNKKCLSIRHKGKVIEHKNSVVLHKPQFVVQQSGRKRVLKNKRKNVHAFVRGLYFPSADNISGTLGFLGLYKFAPLLITYNPYKYRSFMGKGLHDKNLRPINKAEYAIITGKHITAWAIKWHTKT